MKYTNEYIRNSYSFQMTAARVSLILVFIGAIMIAWGFADAYHKVNNRFPMEQIFDISGNQADRIAFIEINDISEKIAEDKYGTCYHLIFDSDNTYLAGMNDEQYASIKEDISNNHTSNLEGKTLLIIDKETLNIMSDYSYIGEDVYLNVGDVSYFSVLKDRVQLIIGGVLTFLFFISAIVYSSELNGYRKIVAISDISPEELDAEAIRNDDTSFALLDEKEFLKLIDYLQENNFRIKPGIYTFNQAWDFDDGDFILPNGERRKVLEFTEKSE